MSNVVLAVLGMIVTMTAFAAFSIIQLAKTEAKAGPPQPLPVPVADERGGDQRDDA
jgi:hypothetical protein